MDAHRAVTRLLISIPHGATTAHSGAGTHICLTINPPADETSLWTLNHAPTAMLILPVLISLNISQIARGSDCRLSIPQALDSINRQTAQADSSTWVSNDRSLERKRYLAELEQIELQNQKLRKETRDISLLTKWGENLAGIAAFVVAIVGFFSLIANYLLVTRGLRNTNMYEALKRVGDKDSPALRVSGSALLLREAQVKKWTSPELSPLRSFPLRVFRRTHPYLTSATEQLLNTVRVEHDRAALDAMYFTLQRMVEIMPEATLESAYQANLRLQEDLLGTLGEFCARFEEENTDYQNRAFRFAGEITGYPSTMLEKVTQHFDLAENRSEARRERFVEAYRNGRRKVASNKAGLPVSQRENAFANAHLTDIPADLQERLWLCSQRLRLNAQLLGFALSRQRSAPKSLQDAFLAEIHLHSTKLNGCDLTRVVLDDAELRKCDLTGTKLTYAQGVQARFLNCAMQKCDWSYSDLSRANLEGSNLSEATLFHTTLHAAALDRCTLNSANMEGSNLREANFTSASLVQTKLVGADVSGANLDASQDSRELQLQGIRWDARTGFPYEWWTADFYDEEFPNLWQFGELLNHLNSISPIPEGMDSQIHESVKHWSELRDHAAAQEKSFSDFDE